MNSKEYYDQVKKWFDIEIVDHEMRIHLDDGLYRHIRYQKPGTGVQYFNLTTFPHHLCISGDMGTYVFSRVEDMFGFFRDPGMSKGINLGYWGEKLKSVSTFGGYEKFNVEEFKECVETRFIEYRDYLDDGDLADKIWAGIKATVVDPANDDGDGWVAMQSAIEYKYQEEDDRTFKDVLESKKVIEIENIFQDFGETGCNRYEHNYIWCLWAIVHGIKMYDEFKRQ